ncbi:DUF2147 domain-containing protein [Arcticibacter tournemirensis]|uniref:DUF2147 domain-containing protein n=1 Tax=Arcticibacter tournemirensis TaxID=699437 RepID=A0A4Q0M5C8_9SPHI|nr:DUF2147 domain-containing protein [Arcticibacter tournemirensis]RXF68200.1 DUF2147 domain-containing protein [Arcticibacter tournemirensis]
MKKFKMTTLIVGMLFLAKGLSAQTADAVLGVFENAEGSRKMEIYKENNQYFGKIVWQSTTKGKVKAGTVLLKGFTYENGKWNGKLYVPARDNDYPAALTLPDSNTLRITVKAGFTSRDKDWKRITGK